mgnify:CR=1 FL=1
MITVVVTDVVVGAGVAFGVDVGALVVVGVGVGVEIGVGVGVRAPAFASIGAVTVRVLPDPRESQLCFPSNGGALPYVQIHQMSVGHQTRHVGLSLHPACAH